MIRFAIAALTAALITAGAAVAAPQAGKKAESTCAAGVGFKVCCKAFVAHHCDYVSCCEVGNAGFHAQKACATCAKHEAKATPTATTAAAKSAAAKTDGKSACAAGACAEGNLYVSAHEMGNGGFFTRTAAHSGKAGAACCAGEAKAK